jgi:uncharacterized cupin superfamily protein
MKKRVDIDGLTAVAGSLYPPQFAAESVKKSRKRIGDAGGLTQYGVNILRLFPGGWSSQRHWHTESDELVYVLSGEVVLVTDGGEEVLRAGDAAAFKAGDSNGHHLQNRSNADAEILEVGTRAANDVTYYSDIDMVTGLSRTARFTRRDGTPYENVTRRS